VTSQREKEKEDIYRFQMSLSVCSSSKGLEYIICLLRTSLNASENAANTQNINKYL